MGPENEREEDAEGNEKPKSFRDLGVVDQLADACAALGWKAPSSIQVDSIPLALAGLFLLRELISSPIFCSVSCTLRALNS